MLALPLPSTPSDENNTVRAICLAKGWSAHETKWLDAFARYRRDNGDPFRVHKENFTPDIGDDLYKLYASLSSQPPIHDVRQTPSLTCCPMCGSFHWGTLDHLLPRKDWPEFSIMLSNLVPACHICNTIVKRRVVKGVAQPERFIHPYFDRMARKPLWKVSIDLSSGIARFTPEPVSNLSDRRKARVSFHIANVLGEQFYQYVDTHWGNLPTVLRIAIGKAPASSALRTEVRNELKRAVVTTGVNAWRTALMRGIIGDPNAMSYLATRV